MGVPVTAPDMVSIIEKVLAAHQPFSSHWDHPREMVNTASCDCGNLSSGAEQPDALHAAHQARAVMAAINETSRPEFGIKGEDRVKPYGRDRRSAQLEAPRRRATFVTRSVTAWTAVEGLASPSVGKRGSTTSARAGDVSVPVISTFRTRSSPERTRTTT